jgi:hypothetical protein
MRKISLLRISLIALLAFGMLTACAAAHGKVLVLKEEGKPVPVGTELGLEMGYHRAGMSFEEECWLAWRGHMSLNGAKEDTVSVEPLERECSSGFEKGLKGRVNKVALIGKRTAPKGGKVLIVGSLRERFGPTCTATAEMATFAGRFDIPGLTDTGVAARATHNGERRTCQPGRYIGLEAKLLGNNGKPLETELIG